MIEKIEKLGPKKIFLLIATIFLLSSIVQFSLTKENRVSGIFFGAPRVYTGDEPGYLLSVFSLVNDSDLHLKNNIQNAVLGGCDQGASYAGKEIGVDLALNPLPSFEDYPRRPIGLPLTAATFLMQFNGSCFLENFSVWLSLLAVFFGLLFFYFLAKRFFPRHAVFFTLAMAFATPLWHYSRTFWTEPWTFLLLTASLHFFLVKKNSFFPALLLSFATLFNYAMFIPLAVFALKAVIERNAARAIAFFVPVLLVVSVAASFNLGVFGSFLDPRMTGAQQQGNFFLGLFSIFFPPDSGIIFSFPAIFFFFFAFAVSKNRKQLFFPFVLVASFVLFYANVEWVLYGTGGWGFRYITPFFAPIFLVIGKWFEEEKNRLAKNVFLALIFVSFLVNAQAAFLAPLMVANPPWFLAQYILSSLSIT